jgi:hypothetical protein
MKKIIGIGIFTLCVLLNACEIHEYDNGDLQGFWHLESIDTLHSGGKNDLSQKRLYWTFESKLLELQDKDHHATDLFFLQEHDGDSLYLSKPFTTDNLHDDSYVTDSTVFLPYGITTSQEHFSIVSCHDDRLILRSSSLQLNLRKW